jgi:archaellum component FlaC
MSAPSLTTEEQLDALHSRIGELENGISRVETGLTEVKQIIEKANTVIEKVGAEVMPTINALTESPALRMFLGKKK